MFGSWNQTLLYRVSFVKDSGDYVNKLDLKNGGRRLGAAKPAYHSN